MYARSLSHNHISVIEADSWTACTQLTYLYVVTCIRTQSTLCILYVCGCSQSLAKVVVFEIRQNIHNFAKKANQIYICLYMTEFLIEGVICVTDISINKLLKLRYSL